MNNNSNNCGDCGTTCSECGRPWAICKQDGGCGCNKCKDIKFCEYGRMANGCIREKQPGCPMQAAIPSVTVESIEGIKNLADCLVHVFDINTTFYIDDKHRPIITWAGPIDIPGYDMEGNPNNYRDQIVTDTANQMAVIYDKSGKGYMFGLVENIDLQEEINNKIDEMVEDGTLQGLFAGYGLEIGADNKVKVKAGTGITVDENGVSESPYVDFIDTDVKTYDYVNDLTGTTTTIYYSIIPAGNKPIVVMADTEDANVRKSASEIDAPYKPSVMINAGPWHTADDTTYGPLIIDGAVKVQNNLADGTDTSRTIVGIKEDGELVSVNGSTPADEVDCLYAVRAWDTVVNHGLDTTAGMNTNLEPRTFIAQSVDGDYLVGVCGGRVYGNTGMTKGNIADFLFNKISFNPKVAFNLDGGTSSNLLYRGIRQNPLISNSDRACPNYIVFSSPTAKHESLFEAQSATNQRITKVDKNKSTLYLTNTQLTQLIPEDLRTSISLINTSCMRILEDSTVILNLNFNVTETISAYTYLMENLPECVSADSAALYFAGVLQASNSDSNNVICQFYIQNYTGKQCAIRNRFAIEAGRYQLHIIYNCHS